MSETLGAYNDNVIVHCYFFAIKIDSTSSLQSTYSIRKQTSSTETAGFNDLVVLRVNLKSIIGLQVAGREMGNLKNKKCHYSYRECYA